MTARIGTSGWAHDEWDGVLYAPGLDSRKRLAAYAAEFDAVELTASRERWPSVASFGAWTKRLPVDFRMVVRAPDALTSPKKRFSPQAWFDRIGAGLTALGPSSGPLLVVVDEGQVRDDDWLEMFLGLAPAGVRMALEFRGDSWHEQGVFDILERHGAAYVVMSGAQLPCNLIATAPFVVVRLHGPDADVLHAGSYPDDSLHWWADRIREWQQTDHEVFATFTNDAALPNARGLKAILAP